MTKHPHDLGHVFHYVIPGYAPIDKELTPEIPQPGYVQEMLSRGEDPKELLMEECKPKCTHWEQKLKRCEEKLEHVVKINPTKSCMYPFRDWVTCVEACVQPLIHDSLVGVADHHH